MNQEGINNAMATNMSLGQQPQVTQPAQAQGLQTMLGQAPAQPVQNQGLQAMTGQAPAQPAQAQGLQAMAGQAPAQPQQQPQPVDGPMVIQSTPSSMGGTPQESTSEPVVNSNGTVSPQVEQPIVFDMGSSTTETQEATEPVQEEAAAPSTDTPEKKAGVVVESLLGDEPKKEQAKPVVEQLVSTGVNSAPKQVDNLVVNTPGTGQGAETLEPAVVQTLNTPQTGGSIKESVESLMGNSQTVQSSGIPRHPEYTLDPEVAKKHEPLKVETL